MRGRATVTIVMLVLGLVTARTARADSITLTGGHINLYQGDPSNASLQGMGFDVGSWAAGGWPMGAAPGQLVDFSTNVDLYYWGVATVNGVRLHGDPSGQGGQVWISGRLNVTAVPFVAPSVTEFTGWLSAPVTLMGTISGYYNAYTQQPLFTVNVVGRGTASGSYQLVQSESGPGYVNNYSSSIRIDPIAATPEPASLLLLGTGLIAAGARRRLKLF